MQSCGNASQGNQEHMLLSLENAVSRAGVSHETIVHNILDGSLEAIKNNEGEWVVHSDDLNRWMLERDIKSPSGIIKQLNNTSQVSYAAAFEIKSFEAALLKDRVKQLEGDLTTTREELKEARLDAQEARKETLEAWKAYRQLSINFLNRLGPQPFVLSESFRVK
jgi:hypothetical protein